MSFINVPFFISVTSSVFLPTHSLTHPHLAFAKTQKGKKRKKKEMDSGVSRRNCFNEEDDGLASLADMEAGFSGNHNNQPNNNYALFSRHLSCARKNLSPSSSSSSSVCFSPRSGTRFYDARFEEQQPHFLDACFLCKKPLGNRDIYMYRGDMPFCSEECRQEKIDRDEFKEKKLSLTSTMKALRKKEQQQQQQRKSTSPNKKQDHSYQTGTVAAA